MFSFPEALKPEQERRKHTKTGKSTVPIRFSCPFASICVDLRSAFSVLGTKRALRTPRRGVPSFRSRFFEPGESFLAKAQSQQRGRGLKTCSRGDAEARRDKISNVEGMDGRAGCPRSGMDEGRRDRNACGAFASFASFALEDRRAGCPRSGERDELRFMAAGENSGCALAGRCLGVYSASACARACPRRKGRQNIRRFRPRLRLARMWPRTKSRPRCSRRRLRSKTICRLGSWFHYLRTLRGRGPDTL